MESVKFVCSCGQTVFEMAPGSSISVEAARAQPPTTNSRYATALEVFNKWFTEHRGASHDTGDFYDWVKLRLNAAESQPHSA